MGVLTLQHLNKVKKLEAMAKARRTTLIEIRGYRLIIWSGLKVGTHKGQALIKAPIYYNPFIKSAMAGLHTYSYASLAG